MPVSMGAKSRLKIRKNAISDLLALDKNAQGKAIEAVRNGGRLSDHIPRRTPSKRETAARSAQTNAPSANAVPDKAPTADTPKTPTPRSVTPSAGTSADSQSGDLGADEVIWSLGEVLKFLRARSPGATLSGRMLQLVELHQQIGDELDRYLDGDSSPLPSPDGGDEGA